jgi:hypothetical protein
VPVQDRVTRTHAKLLGPCFKTGRVDDRPTCSRCLGTDAKSAPRSAGRTARGRRLRRAHRTCSHAPSATRAAVNCSPPLAYLRRGNVCYPCNSLELRPGAEPSPPACAAELVQAATTCSRAVLLPCRSSPEQGQSIFPGPQEAHRARLGIEHRDSVGREGLRLKRLRLACRLNLRPVPTSWFHPFTCKRFHVLFNSLFKVLCNFPSRYLFAIGLTAVFSLRRSLPPALVCTLKQTDSNAPGLAHGHRRRTLRAFHPLRGIGSYSKELAWSRAARQSAPALRSIALKPTGGKRPLRWASPCSLAVTGGIAFAFFSSAD